MISVSQSKTLCIIGSSSFFPLLITIYLEVTSAHITHHTTISASQLNSKHLFEMSQALEFSLQLPLNRGKKRTRNSNTTRKKIRKDARASGTQNSIDCVFSLNIAETKRIILGAVYFNSSGVLKPARTLNNVECVCGCFDEIRIDDKRKIFQDFSKMKDHQMQNVYLRGLIEVGNGGAGRRTFSYSVPVGTRKIQVCRKIFLALHGISVSRLRKKV